MHVSVPVFVINLPRDSARRESMRTRFDPLGVDLTFIEAVDGAAMTPEQWSFYDGEKRRKYFGRDLKPGEIGCLLSHRKIFEKIVTENITVAVILEDDVIPEPDFKDAIIAAANTPPVPWDVIRFLGSKKVYKRGRRVIAPLIGRYVMARIPTAPGGAHGYMVTKHAAEIFLKHTQKNWVPIDTLQGRTWETGLETLVLYPAPVLIDEVAPSTIGDARMEKTVNFKGMRRAQYMVDRLMYRLEDTIGKRITYWGAYLRDTAARRRSN
jgi:glycosyl transferase family 25